MRWLGHGLVLVGLGALIAVNVLAPAAFVVERNVARVLDPALVPEDGWPGLDTDYFGALGDDAVPVLVEALPALPEPYRTATLRVLKDRRALLTTDPALTSPAAWNVARERARAALAQLP